MSVRIYEISKELGLENKEVLSVLKERGFDVKTASSSIDNISAEAFIQEYKADKAPEADKSNEPQTPPESVKDIEPAKDVTEEPKPAAPEVKKPTLPPGAVVKTSAEVEQEREQRKEAAKPKPIKPVSIASEEEESGGVMRAAPRSATPPPPPPLGKAAPKVPMRPGAPMPPPVNRPAPPPVQTDATKAPEKPAPTPDKAPQQKIQRTSGGEVRFSDDGKTIQIKPPVVVREFAPLLGMKPFKLISELMEMNIFASMNQTIEEDTAVKIAKNHGITLEIKHRGEQQAEEEKAQEEEKEKEENLEPRAPVVCVLGHVDHGKTTLLDTIRKANVVSGEAGGITQHVGAYQVEQSGHKITFIDTPGHAAFSKMRERGANVTDVAILVVAADDGFMPQTDEALKFAQKANVPVIVAINKADAKGANIDRVKQQMQQRNLAPEDWGGETLCAAVSALNGDGIEDLLEQVLLQAEILELKANPKAGARGIVVESQVEQGRGPTATIIMQRGTLKSGDALVCGPHYCKVRALMNDKGQRLKKVEPGEPALVLGWSDAPDSGLQFEQVKNDREAKRTAEENQDAARKSEQQAQTKAAETPMDLDNLFAAIESQQEKVFRCVVKSDVHGTTEAIVACLQDIKSDKVKLEVVDHGVGQISKNDIQIASAANATVVGFNVKLENGVQGIAKHEGVQVIQHNIIYELIDQVREGMADLLEPELHENKLGAAEVRQTFKVARVAVAGCMVTEGKIDRAAYGRVLRGGEKVHEHSIDTLRRFKDDVSEVRAGYECGIRVSNFDDYQEGDVIECFEIQKIKPKL